MTSSTPNATASIAAPSPPPTPLQAQLQTHAIRFVRFMWCDNANVIRAKAVHTAALGDYADGAGVGMAAAQMALPVMYDALAPGSGLTPAGEVHMMADWPTLTPLPYASGHARVFTDIFDGDRPWAHCPRSFLRRMIARAQTLGLRIMAAFENEFSLLRPAGTGDQPFDSTVFCQTAGLDAAAPLIQDITDALAAQGMLVEMVYAESGPGQFEMPIRYADALQAADHQIAFRETVHAVARRHDVIASFVPKIYLDKAGNGAHLHFSLVGANGNETTEADGRTLARRTRAFVAGLLRHLPALMAITTPSTNSYKRIRPRFWSGAFTCWGYGNREAAVRVPLPSAHQPVTHLELKTCDATANPYLALGAVIAAGLDGITRDMSPGEPVNMDPADLPAAERDARGIRQLPASLGEAIAALESDEVLLSALGSELARSFLAVRKAEWQAMREMPHDEEVKLLLERY